MGYRNVPMPPTGFARTTEWVAFARQQHLLRSVTPRLEGACDVCVGAVGDSSYSTCFCCNGYYVPTSGWEWPTPVLSRVVPITYSLDEGFESLLHNYKGAVPGYQNRLRAAMLGSVLWEFLSLHRGCLDEIAGPVTHATTLPPRVRRAFRPMIDAIAAISLADGASWGLEWDHELVRRTTDLRHGRCQMNAEYYDLDPARDVTGAVVLAVDDTWTSGATMASVALRLRQAGAAAVIGLPIGRQVGSGTYGTTQLLRQQILERDWDNSRCVVCG